MPIKIIKYSVDGSVLGKEKVVEHRLSQLAYCEDMGIIYPVSNSNLYEDQVRHILEYTKVEEYRVNEDSVQYQLVVRKFIPEKVLDIIYTRFTML